LYTRITVPVCPLSFPSMIITLSPRTTCVWRASRHQHQGWRPQSPDPLPAGCEDNVGIALVPATSPCGKCIVHKTPWYRARRS
jgi:hypothetical protein